MSSLPIDPRRLLAEEPFVRSLAQGLLASEADDVVQQTFLHALEHRPEGVTQPRSWLARVVRNLVTDRVRRRDRREARERAAAVAERVPSPAELVELEDSRRALIDAVNRLSPPLRTVILLRYFEGLPPRRIAAALDLPVPRVWEQLRTALSQLRTRMDANHDGDRRAWMLLWAPVALGRRSLPWQELLQAPVAPGLLEGVLAMTTKTKITMTLAAGLVLAGAWVLWPARKNPASSLPARTAGGAVAAREAAGPAPAPAEPPPARQREAAAVAPAPVITTGGLDVWVRHASEPVDAGDVPVVLSRPGGDFRVDVLRGRTDADGLAQFEELPAGRWEVRTGLAHPPGICRIEPGQVAECIIDLQQGMSVSGIVVDDAGAPVAGAWIEVGEPRHRDPEVLATTGPDGTFALRACPTVSLVGARAPGYASSSLANLHSFDGTPRYVRLELTLRGGIVEGLVVAGDGTPVAGAVVRVGEGRTDSLIAFTGHCPPLPAQVRTDAEGFFRAIGVPAGTQPVQVRALGFAPFRDLCEVAAGRTVPLRVMLSAGANCRGTVLQDDDRPAPGVTVRVGQPGDFVQLFARTAADGGFELHDLAAGEVELSVDDEARGKASARITTVAGATVPCELRLGRGQELRGRVVDELDRPVAGIEVAVAVEGTLAGTAEPGESVTESGPDGRFAVALLPAGCRVRVRAFGNLFDPVRVSGIDPAAGEVLLRVQNPVRSARIRGEVLDVDGAPATGLGIEATWQETAGGARATTDEDGVFELGPLRTGVWRLRITAEGCATTLSPALTLAENDTLDLGTIQLYHGGTLQVRVTGAEAGRLGLVIYDAGGDLVSGMVSQNVPLRSLPLSPGDYDLRVRGEGLAAQHLPFTIRDGEETELDVVVAPGTSQSLRFQVPAEDLAPEWFVFEVRREGVVVLTGTTSRSRDFAAEPWLAPGDYEVVVTDFVLRGSARFTVGREAGPPVHVPLR